jgi:pyruvate dehydrogenase E1 component
MARGFLIGATAGRTTLTGEGLQHMDGHSQILASTNPGVVSYDPAFAYEIAHLLHEGIDRMYGPGRGENVIYYLTVYNEPVSQPAEPENLDVEGLHKGIYLYSPASDAGVEGHEASILASGIGMSAALKARDILAADYNIQANIFSVTSWVELARDGAAKNKEQLRNPGAEIETPFATKQLNQVDGETYVAVSDFATDLQEQIRAFVPGEYIVLGADGFGFSDTRPAARRYFNIDAESIVVAVLMGLAREGKIDISVAAQAAEKYQLDDPTVV